jgi:DeoR/GlpR family transcriptional regulator of sugar metabolism
MILSELKAYLQQRGQVTLADIVHHFDVDADVARNMLQVWINKGKVQRLQAAASCGSSCSQCEPMTTEIYVWGTPVEGQQFVRPDCGSQ